MKNHRRADTGKEVAAALKAVEDLLDGPGDVMFRVAQLDFKPGVPFAFDFDQILKSQSDELVTIFDQNIKVGVGDCCLIAGGCLEGYGSDAILLPGFLLQFRLFLRINEFDPDPALPSHLVFAQQIAQLWLQRGQQRMDLRGKKPQISSGSCRPER